MKILKIWLVLFGILAPSVLIFILYWNSSYFLNNKRSIQNLGSIFDNTNKIEGFGSGISISNYDVFIGKDMIDNNDDDNENDENQARKEALKAYLKTKELFNISSEESAINFRRAALEIGNKNQLDDENVYEMWRNLDEKWKINPNEKDVKYFVYQPSGGWGNQRLILRWAMSAANAMDRTLVIPMM